jgi:hypothetical protein
MLNRQHHNSNHTKMKMKKRKKNNSVTNPTNRNLNLNPRTRGNRRSETEELRLKNEILNLSNSRTDLEIMDILKMPITTYYRYKSNLYQEQREVWQQTYREGIELRIIHTINSLHLALRINEEIILDKKQSAKDRMEAGDKLVELQMKYLDLISDMNESDNNTAVPEPESRLGPKPTDYPTIIDPNNPNNPNRWITDPEWIRESGLKVMRESNLNER